MKLIKSWKFYYLKKFHDLNSESTIGILQFFDIIIREKESVGASIVMYKQVENEIEKFRVDDCSL